MRVHDCPLGVHFQMLARKGNSYTYAGRDSGSIIFSLINETFIVCRFKISLAHSRLESPTMQRVQARH